MGCFDTIHFSCPNCAEPLDAQSKGGDCLLGNYPYYRVPVHVATDANRHAPIECPSCNKRWYFDIPDVPFVKLGISEFEETNGL